MGNDTALRVTRWSETGETPRLSTDSFACSPRSTCPPDNRSVNRDARRTAHNPEVAGPNHAPSRRSEARYEQGSDILHCQDAVLRGGMVRPPARSIPKTDRGNWYNWYSRRWFSCPTRRSWLPRCRELPFASWLTGANLGQTGGRPGSGILGDSSHRLL